MKSLKESLLDDEDVLVDKTSIKELIIEWLEKYNIKNYKINNDHTIDVNGDVLLTYYKESQLPDYIQFNKVNGKFDIKKSQIKTLKGCPRIIKGCFNCFNCKNLESLEGASEIVDGDFDCSFCDSLKSLKGSPETVEGSFDCADCINLKTLEGAPKKVWSNFNCSYCDSLKSLKGSPKQVKKTFYCEFCRSLESLKGAPKNCEIEYSGCPKIK